MLRSRTMPLAIVVAIVLLGYPAGHGSAEEAPPQAARRTVTVTVTCSASADSEVEITVKPWNVAMSQDDEVQWVIGEGSGFSSMEIEPKGCPASQVPPRACGNWPFTNANGVDNRYPANANPRAGAMKPNAGGAGQLNRTYTYGIRLQCQAGDYTFPVDIDPGMRCC